MTPRLPPAGQRPREDAANAEPVAAHPEPGEQGEAREVEAEFDGPDPRLRVEFF